jgi:FkbM family methyltransferase
MSPFAFAGPDSAGRMSADTCPSHPEEANGGRLNFRALASTFVAASVLASGSAGFVIGRQFQDNHLCCAVPAYRNVGLSVRQLLGVVRFHSQIGQDIWVLETALPGVRDGYFLDVGSGDGTIASNTKALEERGWKGICVDPFPTHMDGRTCQMFREVVYSEAGKRMAFRTAGELGGLADTLGEWKAYAEKSPTVEFTTVTLRDILAKAKAPQRIDFMSLDIEGAELEALRGFPFDRYQIGALDVEHNFEEPKRSEILALMNSHGYARVHTWYQDDFYLPRRSAPR